MSRLPRTPPSYRDVLTSVPARKPVPLMPTVKWPAGPTPLSYDQVEALVAEAHDTRAGYLRTALVRVLRKGTGLPRRTIAAFRDWRRRVREREELAQLDDRALRDMGISRYDVLTAGRRPKQDRLD